MASDLGSPNRGSNPCFHLERLNRANTLTCGGGGKRPLTCGFSCWSILVATPSISDVMPDRYGIRCVRRATTTLASPTTRLDYPAIDATAGTAIHDPSSIPASPDELELDPRECAGLVVARRHGQHRRAGAPSNRQGKLGSSRRGNTSLRLESGVSVPFRHEDGIWVPRGDPSGSRSRLGVRPVSSGVLCPLVSCPRQHDVRRSRASHRTSATPISPRTFPSPAIVHRSWACS